MNKFYYLEDEDDDKWELKRKKEQRRWIWTGIVVFVAMFSLGGYINHLMYDVTTVIKIYDRVVNKFSFESYRSGEIDKVSDNHKDNKHITLSKEEVSDLMVLLRDTPVKGLKEPFKDRNMNPTNYIVILKSDNRDASYDIVLFIGQDESSKEIIFEILKSNRSLAKKYVAKGEDLYNMINDLVEKTP
ncbi:hypothetical protein PB01_09660 [Psychrobacillus glaciei]|uniref:Uncharacterized protein n=1 Tax=Psychrobacillus glaciei TaxID=2283160 RepID=A0A5J6SMZ9_9BACI|nr:hypothetical protein [Psychrobacillus glaciei]QFF99072.1 hypothetical protein PB01_09660 [Psychrobacillus glaciei]